MDAQNRQPQHFSIKSSQAGVIADYMPMLNQDISLNVLDQQQSKEQAKLLQRFKQLKEWQKEQQDKLIRQQQEQLHVLRNEQQRVQSILSAQRHKQWGGGVSVLSPGKQKSGVFKINSSTVTSTSSLSTDLMAPSTNQGLSTDIPLGHAMPPHVIQTLLQTVPPTRDNPQIDLDSTGEAPHSDTEDGFYPLPETSSEISHQDAEELQMLGERRIDKEDSVEDNVEEIIDNHFDNNIQNNNKSHCKENNDKEDDNNNISNVSNDFDNQPVSGKGKRFEELLEQQLSLETQQEIQKPPTIETKPKRNFLKRGQGISRFGMKTFKLKKKEINGKVDEKRTKEMNGKVNESSKLQTRNEGKLKKTNKSKPNEKQTTQISRKVAVKPLTPTNRLVLKPEPKPASKSAITKSTIVTSPVGVMSKPIQSHVKEQEFAGQGSLSKSDLDDTIEVSFQNKVLDWQVRVEEEKDDLDEFELLEQAADDNASFSSNASLVLKVMQRAAMKNQIKDPKDVRDGSDPSSAIDGLSNKIAQHSNQNGKKFSEEHKVIERKRQSMAEDFEMMEQGLRDEDENNERRKGGSPTEEDESDTLEEDEIDDNSDASDYSPKMKRISTLHSRQVMAVKRNEEEDEVELDGNDDTPQKMTSSHQLDIDFDDDESWGEFAADDSSSGDENITAGDPVIGTNIAANENDDRCFIQHQQPIIHVETNGQIASSTVPQRQMSDFSTEESAPPMAELASKLFPTLKKQPTEEQVHHQAQLRQAHAIPLGQGVQSKLLRDKLCELEKEIERFRTENSALAKLRAEREKDLELLKNEIATFEKQKNEELKRLEEFKAEETKKLKKERRNFEKYQQAMKSMPDKKGREEIERLKDEISELQEELNNKERRWTASSSRLHKRIEVLNDENNKLRDDIKQFEEKRLENLQKDSSKKKVKKKKSSSQLSYQALPEVYVPSTQALPEMYVPSTQAHPRQEEGDFDIDSQDKNQHDIKSLKINTPVYDKSPKKQKDKEKSPEKSPETDHQPRPSAWGWPHSQENDAMKGNSNEEISKESGKLSEEDGTDNSIQHPDGKVEHVNKDGSRVILFKNGTRKDISSNGETITVTFFNGDIKQILPDQRVVYYYQETQTTHTTYQDGLEILQFANNQMEKHYPDGTKEITFPDQTIKYLFPNGREESIFGDGTVLRMEQNGDKVMEFANGQREVHTAQYKKREYPDGTVKTVYPDGRQETRYSTGRIRVKDKDGTVIVDQKT
ncbi:centrosomal P4.1-associated protein-like [Antedon mediterranea]|uniref:centrosomal P4.1-associated protein-like n=1 Tax=Antedon mediterranea TaxID=105859 RepID=UPI003AF410BE